MSYGKYIYIHNMALCASARFDKFCAKHIDLITEYESTEGVVPLESVKYDVCDKIGSLTKQFRGCSFNETLSEALSMSIFYKQSILESISTITNRYLQGSAGINITQMYFNEIEEKYKKNHHNYNIEYTPENRDKLIEMNLKSVISVAKSYQGLGLSLNELISAGNLGLCVAWDKYDPSKARLKDDMLGEIEKLPDEMTIEEVLSSLNKYFRYGTLKEKLIKSFPDSKKHSKADLIKWVDKNVTNAKFSSIATMWIKAYILIEIDNYSRMVKKPKSEIYKDKAATGTYTKEVVLDLDAPLTSSTDTTFADTLGLEDDTSMDMEIIEAYDAVKDGLNKMFEGVCMRDRSIVLRKFGCGLPRAMAPREIADYENVSLARISQIIQQTFAKMRKNAEKYDLDITDLLQNCQKFR